MARTIQEIYDSIIAEKEAQTELNALQPAIDDSQTLLADLTTTSKVAIWRLWAWTVAVAVNVHENIFDLFQAEIETRAEEIPTGTSIWYYNEVLKFQFGDVLVWSGTQYNYDPIITNNRIIDVAAIVDNGFQVRVKVAKFDVLGDPEALSVAELSAAQGYFNQIKFAGTPSTMTSSDGDDIKLDYFIKYNALVLSPIGESLASPGTFPVLEAIKVKIKGLPFNGVLSLMELTDSIQLVEGVLDVTLNSAEAKFGALPYTLINKQYTPDAGYLILDEINSVFNYNISNV
jgi:hypothetical protein